MKELTRQDFLTKQNLKIKQVDLGDGIYTYVKEMTGRERNLFEQSALVKKKAPDGSMDYEQDLNDFQAKLATFCLSDKDGNLLMQQTDYANLSKSIGAKRLNIIVEAAQKLNGISKEDKEDLIKNSSGVPSDNSNSDSVEN